MGPTTTVRARTLRYKRVRRRSEKSNGRVKSLPFQSSADIMNACGYDFGKDRSRQLRQPESKTGMLLRIAIAAILLIGDVSAANARAMLDRASPAVGSTVRRAPSHITLWFTQALLPSESDAVVRNATGGVVSSGKARIVGSKARMQVPVKSLSPRKYRVEWYAISRDRQQTQGSFNFTVRGK